MEELTEIIRGTELTLEQLKEQGYKTENFRFADLYIFSNGKVNLMLEKKQENLYKVYLMYENKEMK